MHLAHQPCGEGERPGAAACGPAVVAFEGAAAALGGRVIWENATFQIHPGEFIAVVGPNGCGKSTLLRMILGQVRAHSGRVTVLGAAPRLGNRAVGLVPQRRELTSGLAIRGRDLVLLGVEGTRWGLGRPSAAARRQAKWALDAVNARAFADEPMGVLSGGEQQRLLIAQALAPDLKVLLLDEPLASLDLCSQQEIVALVDGLRRPLTPTPLPRGERGWGEGGIAVLFVCHDLNPVLPVLDRVLYILNRCPVCGGVDEVVQPELLSHLFGTPVQVCHTHEGGRLVHGPIHHRPLTPSPLPGGEGEGVRGSVMPDYAFMVNPFLAATLAAVCAGVVGYFVVLRRLSFASHALAHVGFTGATAAVLIAASLGLAANALILFLGTLAFTVATAVGMGLLGDKLRGRDTAIGTTLAFTMGLGLFFLSLTTKMASLATNIMFGDVVAVSGWDVVLGLCFTVVSLGTMAVIYRPLLFASVDPEVAAVRGVPVRGLGLVFMMLLAWTTAQAVQVVGVLLIFAAHGDAGGRRAAPDGAAGAWRGLVGAAGGRLGLGRADGGLLLPVPARLLYYDDLVSPVRRRPLPHARRRQLAAALRAGGPAGRGGRGACDGDGRAVRI